MNSGNPLVSIVVPIYNNEDKIEECVNSLIAQSLKDIEIILIDDGSNDKSGEIIDDIKLRDSRITVVHQDNKGVSSTRNVGIRIAKGEFVGFVDSDDYVDYSMYEKLYFSVKNNNTSMGMCRFATVIDNLIKNEEWDFDTERDDLQEYIFFNMIGKNDSISFNMEDTIMGSTCRCIYKRDLLNKYSIFFDEDIAYAEDLLFNLKYLSIITKISLVDEVLYYYKIKKQSLSRGYKEEFYTGIKELMNRIQEVSTNRNIEKRLSYAWFKYLIESLRNSVKDVMFLDLNRYKKVKLIVCDKDNRLRLKDVEHKTLYFKNKILYCIFYNNMFSLAVIFCILKCVKNLVEAIKELRICMKKE